MKLQQAKPADRLSVKIVTGILFFLLFCGFVVCGFLIYKFFNDTRFQYEGTDSVEVLDLDTTEITDEEKDAYKVSPEKPRYLSMKSIGVERARIIEVGVLSPNADGVQQMDAPKNTSDVGWYNCQINPIVDNRCADPALPGGGDTSQAAIIDGHTCFSTTYACVFDKLRSLRINDAVMVELGDGTILNYIVKKVEIRELDSVDMNALMKPIEPGKEGLNFISCAGYYQGATDANGVLTASQRVLVWTILE